MGLLKNALFIREVIMKIYQIDNPKLLINNYSKNNNFQASVKGRKIVILPNDIKLIDKGCLLPQIKYERENSLLKKYCPTCKEWLYTSNFNKQKTSPDGLKDQCRDCDNLKRRVRYARKKTIT